MINQVTMHLKQCNPNVCQVKDRKTLEVSHEDEHRWLQVDNKFSNLIYNAEFYKQIYVKYQSSKCSGN